MVARFLIEAATRAGEEFTCIALFAERLALPPANLCATRVWPRGSKLFSGRWAGGDCYNESAASHAGIGCQTIAVAQRNGVKSWT